MPISPPRRPEPVLPPPKERGPGPPPSSASGTTLTARTMGVCRRLASARAPEGERRRERGRKASGEAGRGPPRTDQTCARRRGQVKLTATRRGLRRRPWGACERCQRRLGGPGLRLPPASRASEGGTRAGASASPAGRCPPLSLPASGRRAARKTLWAQVPAPDPAPPAASARAPASRFWVVPRGPFSLHTAPHACCPERGGKARWKAAEACQNTVGSAFVER